MWVNFLEAVKKIRHKRWLTNEHIKSTRKVTYCIFFVSLFIALKIPLLKSMPVTSRITKT